MDDICRILLTRLLLSTGAGQLHLHLTSDPALTGFGICLPSHQSRKSSYVPRTHSSTLNDQ